MDEAPFFSIIIPVYNVEKYLDRCLESVLKQEFNDYEIILVDDGSTDTSSYICDSYKQSEKVTVIHKDNGGLSSARNCGLDISKGEYIFFVDSDDYICPGTLKILYDNLSRTNVDVIKFNYILQPSGKVINSILKDSVYQKEQIIREVLPLALTNISGFMLSASTHVYRREFLNDENIKFTSEREVGSEDFLFNESVFLRANSMMHINNALYNYDYREGSLTKRYRNNLIDQYRVLYLKMHESLGNAGISKYEEDLVSAALSRFYLWNGFYVVIGNERLVTEQHSKKDGLNNIRKLLNQSEYREVVKQSSVFSEKGKRKIYLFLLKLNNTRLIYTMVKFLFK